VINLVEDKKEVLQQIFRVLKTGGEFYFSDIYTDRRIPDDLKKNRILYGECLGGALYVKDFERLASAEGFTDPRIISKRMVDIKDKEIRDTVGNISFYSITYRLWKLKGLEDCCEDYGHIAVYQGGIIHSPFKFELDRSHIFEKGKPERICGNTALMLSGTRLKKFFAVTGNFDTHFGEFKGCSDNTVNSNNCC
jgi:SAM-dependent methyltransferase